MYLRHWWQIISRPSSVVRRQSGNTEYGIRNTRKGLTLIELMIVIALFVILIAVMVFILRAVLLSWSSQETRSGIDISLDRAIEEMIRDLREAKVVLSSNDEIRFTQEQSTYYIYYLYNSADTYPPNFNQSLYAVRKTTLTGGIGGTFTYGSGQIIINDVLAPPTADLSVSGNIVTIDLSITQKEETIRSRTQVRPRNL